LSKARDDRTAAASRLNARRTDAEIIDRNSEFYAVRLKPANGDNGILRELR
jgi:hypothetical protein